MKMASMMSPTQVATLIAQGKKLFLAGSEEALKQLPKGEWIGGTIPYFMTDKGGLVSNTEILVTPLPPEALQVKIQSYTEATIQKLPQDYFENGFSLILIPAFSDVHQKFAKDCSTWPGLFNQPLVGWVTGVDLNSQLLAPQVMNGQTGILSQREALVMHVDLPKKLIAKANIINIFQQGDGDSIRFPQAGFEVTSAIVNDKPIQFSEYLKQKKIDPKLPLVADYMGAMINVSFRDVSPDGQSVRFFAPVFPEVEYKVAKPVSNYEIEFEKALKDHQVARPIFACNCILNFLYANLEGKKSGHLANAMTFGEIAYMLLNQTFVYISLTDQVDIEQP